MLKENNNYYIYDVNSNEFVEVDDCIYYLFKTKRIKDKENVGKLYSEADISAKLNAINESMQKEKLFLPNQIHEINLFSSKNISDELKQNVNQLTLMITENCNLDCGYCIYSGNYKFEKKHSAQSMSVDTAIKEIDFLILHKNKEKKAHISFFGGEPLLNFDLLSKCVKYIHEKYNKEQIGMSITTNSVLINDEIIDFMIKHKIGIVISLDGPKEINDRYRIDRNGNGSFNKIFESISKIKIKNIEYYHKYVIFDVTIAPPYRIEETENFFDSNELFEDKLINVNLMNQGENSFYKKYDLDETIEKRIFYQQEKRILKKYCEKISEGSIKKYPFLRGYFDSDFYSIHFRSDFRLNGSYSFNHICVPGTARLLVDYSGKLFFCTNASSAMSIGSIHEGFNENKIGTITESYRKVLKTDCLKCWAIRFCNICYIHAMQGEGFCEKKRKRYCVGLKRKLNEEMKMYLKTIRGNESGYDYLGMYSKSE